MTLNLLLRKAWFVPCLVAILIALPGVKIAHTQVTGGTILGTVTDPSGLAVANANVTITEEATGVARSVTTNSAGLYSAPNLLPGQYEIKVSAGGFATGIASGITLTVGESRVQNVGLKVGSVNATVEVSEVAAVVDTSTSTITAEVDGGTIRELPLNGRDWAQLATLEPGVDAVRNQSPVGGVSSGDVVRALRGFGNQLSISGARPTQNNYRLDGVSINDYTNGAPGGVLGSLSGVDAIREFSILTTNYSAEYGRTSGGVINAITRSGTNQFHGSAFEFLRNSALDARNYFDGPTVPPFRRNQFGGTIGGPLVKDRTFWFFNYEGLRQSLTSTQVDIVPSNNARKGILSTGNVQVSPLVLPYLTFWPAPNTPTTGDVGNYDVKTLQTGTDNFYTARVDHKLGPADSLAASFGFDKTQVIQPDPLNNLDFVDQNTRPFFQIEETHTFSSSLLNSVRLGFNRNRALSTTGAAINPAAADVSLGSVPGRPAPTITVPGITRFQGGLGGFPNFTFGWNSFQGYDDAFLTRGTHSLKFGFAVERMQSNNLLHFADNGGFTFGSLSDFLSNNPFVFSSTVPATATERGIRETLFGGYIQDDWRFRSNLTLNLGMRYEMVTVPTEVQDKLAVLRNISDTQAHLGNPYFNNPTLRNLEPRIGFAWAPFHDGKTAVRSGFGFFDVLPLPYEFVILSSASAPYAANVSIVSPGQGSFPTGAYNAAISKYVPGNLVGQRVSYIQPDPARSYVMQWNLNVQRELAPNVTATVAYVGSRGVHLPFREDDMNIVLPTHTSQGYVWPVPLYSGKTVNPVVGEEDRLVFGADSYYHSLQAGISANLAKSLQLRSSFTWGKSIDTGSSTIAGDQFANSPSSLPGWYDARVRRGVSDFNLGKYFVLSGNWNIPTPDSVQGPMGWVFKGWVLGGILEASTGAPFTVVMGGDPVGENSTDPWDYPSRINAPGCGNPINVGNAMSYIKTQCFEPATAPTRAFYNQYCDPSQPFPTCINLLGNTGRNPLTGPGLVNTDFSIFKNIPMGWMREGANLQFRAEFFNIFNRANFDPPNDNNVLFAQSSPTSPYTPVQGAGLIDHTQTTSRQIQFGLKLTF